MHKFLKVRAVVDVTGVSKAGIYSKIAKGEFPKQVKLGEKASAWLESDIQAWIENRIAASKAVA